MKSVAKSDGILAATFEWKYKWMDRMDQGYDVSQGGMYDHKNYHN